MSIFLLILLLSTAAISTSVSLSSLGHSESRTIILQIFNEKAKHRQAIFEQIMLVTEEIKDKKTDCSRAILLHRHVDTLLAFYKSLELPNT